MPPLNGTNGLRRCSRLVKVVNRMERPEKVGLEVGLESSKIDIIMTKIWNSLQTQINTQISNKGIEASRF